ncbi:MAG: alanine--glyoxylate aminotransferase family protein [Armatimonadota bacterium]|nr:alanine--glyoxylate aminotransferase family protein [Armatimonadota bacterium]
MTPEWPFLSLGAGPGEVSNRTLRDHMRPVVGHYDPMFIAIFERTIELLQRVYETRHDVVVLQGETVLGMEAAAASLFAPGDVVLNLVSGIFGKWFEGFITRAGAQTLEVGVPYNEAIDPEDVRRALRAHPGVKFLSVVHAETPSGTVNPVRDICAVAREFDVITIVDTALGLGGEPLHVDEWGIDLAVAGPQKCLGGVPGLALLAISPGAWAAMERRAHPFRRSYLSLLDWRDTWAARRAFPHTPSVSLVYALESVLAQVLEVGLERHIARHRAVAHACRAGVSALGLKLWPARDAIASSAVTTVRTPDGLDAGALLARMRERYGVGVAGGYGELAGTTFRLGHMGRSAHPAALGAMLAVLERSLADLGRPVAFGAGVGAAMATLATWE